MSDETMLDEQEYDPPKPRPPGGKPPPLRSARYQSAPPPPADGGSYCGGAERIEVAAADLLYLAAHIRQIEAPRNQSYLLREMVAIVLDFKRKIERAFSEAMVDEACYLLCATLDDLVINETGWGTEGEFRRGGLS